MKKEYIHIYNKIVKLTRNKDLYKNLKKQDSFSDRLIYFLLHFSFFLNVYSNKENKKILQDIYDYIFRQLELSIREIGYSDQSINKRMKDYINLLYEIIGKTYDWKNLSLIKKKSIIGYFVNNLSNEDDLVEYFEKYRLNLINNTLNFQIKGVNKG
jgi:cytochrome b pre-mRNA-processing protein 3